MSFAGFDSANKSHVILDVSAYHQLSFIILEFILLLAVVMLMATPYNWGEEKSIKSRNVRKQRHRLTETRKKAQI